MDQHFTTSTVSLNANKMNEIAETEVAVPAPMRVVLMSRSGTVWTIWLPATVAGHFRFQDDDGIEAELPFYVEATDGKWVAYSGKTAIFRQQGSGGVDRLIGHEITLTDRMLITLVYRDDKFVLYSESVHPGDSTFLPYYFEERTDYIIGRREDCDIFYPNITVSRIHARLHWENDAWHIVDQFSTNGVYVNGHKVEASQRLFNGDCIFIMGLYILVGVGFFSINNANDRVRFNTPKIRRIRGAEDVTFTACPKVREENPLFDRLPRKMIKIDPQPIDIDMPPMQMSANKIPLLLRLGSPMVMGGRAIATGNILMALTSLVFPALTQGLGEKDRKDYEAKRTERYHQYLQIKAEEIEKEQHLEEQLLNQNYPALSEVMQFTTSKKRLWERRTRDEDFLKIRIGAGEIPLIAEKNFTERRFEMEPDPLSEEMYALAEQTVLLKNAPVMLSLQEDRAIGVLGDTNAAVGLLRNLILQIAVTHSYDEVKLIVFVEKEYAKRLDFVRYLPHNWDDDRSIRFFASTPSEVQQIGAYLSQQMEPVISAEDPARILKDRQRYVIMALSKKLFDSVEIMKAVLHHEHDCGVAVFAAFEGIPKECTKIIDLRAEPQIIDLMHPENQTQPFTIDSFHFESAQENIRTLMKTKLKLGSQLYALPNMITFLEMFNVGRVEHLNILKRWADHNPVKSLAAPVGLGTDGKLFTLDLHEKHQGPHGLVAGMTGSGKSEFIITYILSMAVNFSPDEVAFILIDYKGGGLADAFEDKARGIHLPHLVGTITNLDGAAIQRSLMSINSELKRRQSVFKQVKSDTGEGTMDIYDYQKLYRAGRVKEPMPHLFIISDEFAELKAQQPEFMDELISAARIGRSLGVHLILATQKPGGVVNNQIWSNTKFRVCLKVQDRSDSMEMLKRPEAAELKQTGRFYLQVGYNEYFALGQSAWCGAGYVPQDEVAQEIDDSVQFLDNAGQTILTAKPEKPRTAAQGKQIVAIVQYLSDLAKTERVGAKQLWMEPLPAVLDYDDLEKQMQRPAGGGLYALIGMADDPERQDQHPYWLDLMSFRNMMLCGSSGSGKSTYLRTMLYSLVSHYSPEEVNYYIIDLSNGALFGFSGMEHCGAYLTERDDDDVVRLFQMIKNLIGNRKRMFAEAEVDSYEAYRRLHPLPLVLIIIDGFTNFPSLSCGDAYFTKLHEFLRDGANYGVRYIFSVNHTNEISSRAKMEIDMHVALQAKDRFEYADILEVKCPFAPPALNGRGICVEEDRPLEYHTALLDSTLEEQERNAALRERLAHLGQKYSGIPSAEKLPTLDLQEPFRNFCSRFDKSRLPIGYGTEEIKPVAIPLHQLQSMSLYFGNPKGVGPVLVNLLTGAAHCGMEVILVKRSGGSTLEDLAGRQGVQAAFPCVSTVLSCSDEDLQALSARILDEIVARNVLRDAYCEEQGIPPTASGRAKKAAKYIRANSKPLLVLFERFSDFCMAEMDEELEGKFEVYFEQMVGYNVYLSACFYSDDDSRLKSNKLAQCYNRQELLLLFGGRYDKVPMTALPYNLSKLDKIDQQLDQYIMKYQQEFYSMAMPGIQQQLKAEDPDDLPII